MTMAFSSIFMLMIVVCLFTEGTSGIVNVSMPTADFQRHGGAPFSFSQNALGDYKLVLENISSGLFHIVTQKVDQLSLLDVDEGLNCVNDTGKIIQDLETGTPYALHYVDAAAKLPSGILDMKWMWVGDYEECKSIPRVNNPGTGHEFGGKHFLVFVYINGKPPFPFMPLPLSIGVCLPDSCSTGSVTALFSSLLADVNEITIVGASTSEKQEYSEGAIVALVVCGIFGCLVGLGTLLDLWEERQKKEKPELPAHENAADFNIEPTERTGLLAGDNLLDNIQHRRYRVKELGSGVLKCFSFTGNTAKLLSTTTAVGPLACLNGLRVISMWWVIQGHSYGFSTMFIDNLAQAGKITQRFDFQAIVNGTFSVDTFFFLSGLLVAYLALKEIREKGRLNWIYFFVHRYWRLTALYAIVLMLFTTMTIHFVNGPYQFLLSSPGSVLADSMVPCEKYWWTNLLYINNFYPNEGNINTTCMGWTWYLANDMQFYIALSPIIIFLLSKRRRIGVVVTVSLIAVGVAIRGGLVGYYGLTDMGNNLQKHTDDKWGQNGVFYQRPYARYSVYLVGMLTGYVLSTTRCKLRMNKVFVVIGWIVATATGLAVVYGQYYYNKHPESHMTEVQNGFYASFCRTAWSVSLAWVVLACASGYGGPVHSILSFKIWAPLGRLTYAAYLVHPIVMATFYANLTVPLHFTDLMMIYMFIGNLVISYGIAYVLSMAVEAPMIQLEKLVLKQFRTLK